MPFKNPNAKTCAITGSDKACVSVEADGRLNGGWGSKHDTINFIGLDGLPEGLKPGDHICDEAVDRLVAEGKIAAYASDRYGAIAASPMVLKAAFPIDRDYAEKGFAKLKAGQITASKFLGLFLDTRQTPDTATLAILDVLVEAATGKAPGVDELLAPWLHQRQLRNALDACLGGKPQIEGADDPLHGVELHIIDRT
jgi:hypothetical protein